MYLPDNKHNYDNVHKQANAEINKSCIRSLNNKIQCTNSLLPSQSESKLIL